MWLSDDLVILYAIMDDEGIEVQLDYSSLSEDEKPPAMRHVV